MKIAILAAAALLGLAAANAALAQAIEMPPPAASVVGKPSDGDKVVCRDEEKTGQRFKSRVCHTKTQWAAMGEFGRSQLEASQMGSKANTCSAGGC
jgi:invasion protein IalB